jgi:hypothetical protein
MKRLAILKALVVAGVMGLPALAVAEAGFEVGKHEYETRCALCHGINAKGGGAFGELLQITIPDLTTLSRKNGGRFPVARVYGVIDGREELKAHGPREMPIWGQHFAREVTLEYDDYRYLPEEFVRSQILALIDYLNSRQE